MPLAMTELADQFRALADPTRLRIAALIRTMELSVGELAQVLEQSQPRVSRHVRILVDAGLASRRREGSWVFLTPGLTPLSSLLHALLDRVAVDGEAAWLAADTQRLVAVRADRAAAAARYFAAQAEHWDGLRLLSVPESEVEARIRALMGGSLGRLVDLGTGTGRMIELLGDAATRATGVDRSPEMLRLARAKLDGRGVDLRQGDVTALPLDSACADTVILHQVLHYLDAPERALAEASRLLTPGGHVLIVDFAPHDREDLRTSDAHARLGFSDTQIAGWLEQNGVALDATETLEGGELTVKLWRGHRPAQQKAIAA